jgi:hypothetical protein
MNNSTKKPRMGRAAFLPASSTVRKKRTERQKEAARRNGARSRGPKSIEGKARSRRNAMKHGFTAFTLSPEFHHDDRAAFSEFLEDLLQDYDPTTALGKLYAQKLADAAVTLFRIKKMMEELLKPTSLLPEERTMLRVRDQTAVLQSMQKAISAGATHRFKADDVAWVVTKMIVAAEDSATAVRAAADGRVFYYGEPEGGASAGMPTQGLEQPEPRTAGPEHGQAPTTDDGDDEPYGVWDDGELNDILAFDQNVQATSGRLGDREHCAQVLLGERPIPDTDRVAWNNAFCFLLKSCKRDLWGCAPHRSLRDLQDGVWQSFGADPQKLLTLNLYEERVLRQIKSLRREIEREEERARRS